MKPLPRYRKLGPLFERKRTLSFKPIKTKEQFNRQKHIHDDALAKVDATMFANGWDVKPLALDSVREMLRENEDKPFVLDSPLPDRVATIKAKKIAYDVKWKKSYLNFGILNLRHLEGYKLYAKTTKISTFIVFCDPNGLIAHANVESPFEEIGKEWDKNDVVKLKNLKEGLPE